MRLGDAVLVDWFGAQNVTSVPSISGFGECLMVQVRQNMPVRTDYNILCKVTSDELLGVESGDERR